MKKILIALVAISLVSAAFLFLKRPTPATQNTPVSGSPFGSSDSVPALGSNSVGKETKFDGDQQGSEEKLFRISNVPVAGFVVFQRGSDEIVRYVDRGTGHISDAALPKAGIMERIKITNKTLPKIYEAVFRPDGGEVLLRSLESDSDRVINLSLSLTAPKASSSNGLYSVGATSLRGNIDGPIAFGNLLLYTLKDTSGITLSSFTGGSARTLFSSPFDNWKIGRIGGNILVSTKASSAASGYVYSLPSGGGQLTRLAGPFLGLSGVGNSKGDRLLYSYNDSGTIRLFLKTIAAGSVTEIAPSTLSEKCVWSLKQAETFYCASPLTPFSGNEPDDWYLGVTHTSDYIWSFDIKSQQTYFVVEPKTQYGIDIDVFQPTLSPQEDFLLFINKRDQTLWASRI